MRLIFLLIASIEGFLHVRDNIPRRGIGAVASTSSILDGADGSRPLIGDPRNSREGVLSLSLPELTDYLGGSGRAKMAWNCYKQGIDPVEYYSIDRPEEGPRLGQATLDKLVPLNEIGTLSYTSIAQDGTTKLLLKLKDGHQIEAVIIPWNNTRSSLCISSQVGCRQGCVFCATGKMGILRNLTADEIMLQMITATRVVRESEHLPDINSVVFMGMGEPADNAEAVVRAVNQLTTQEFFRLKASRVTVSTVGPSPAAFETLGRANCALAWSVHAVDDRLRRRLVPTTRYSMKELRRAFIEALQNRRVKTCMLEVALIKGINDSPEHAYALSDFAQGIVDAVPSAKVMVNLIPYNDIGYGYETPSTDAVWDFQNVLYRNKSIFVHTRTTRGDDKSAACGQLATTVSNGQKQ